METHKKMKMEQTALKLYIFACGIGLTAYAGLLCFGIRTPLAERLSMSSAFVLLTMGAWAFRLCWVAYMMIAYMYTIRCCIILQEVGFWGKWIDVAHWVAFIIGLIVCFLFIYKCIYNCYEKSKDDC